MALLAAEIAVTYVLLHLSHVWSAGWVLFLWLGAAWLTFAAASAALVRVPRRAAIGLVLLGGAVLQVLAVWVPPQTSGDYYRYVWDGSVQAAGIDPYRYSPVDPALARLRGDLLFPPGYSCPTVPVGCPVMNHPTAHTIYPPVAEAYFLGVHDVSPAGATLKSMQIAAALAAFATTVALLVASRWTGTDPRRAALWSWCPLVVFEAGNNAHVDVVAALLVVVALALLARRRVIVGAVALGLAIATKLLPVLLVPSAIRRRPTAVLVSSGLAVATVYLPHVMSVGTQALGFLPGYLDEEAANRFALLGLLLPTYLAPGVGAVILAVTAYLCWAHTDPDRPWATAAVMVAVAFIVITPPYSWYGLLLVPLVAMGARAVFLVLPVAMTAVYLTSAVDISSTTMRQVSYGCCAVVLTVAVLVQRGRSSRERST